MPESQKRADARRRRFRYRLARRIYRWKPATSNTIRSRVSSLLISHYPWWDWGHRLMVLTGSDYGGNWAEPEPPTWWYRRVPRKPMWCTGYPRSGFQVVTNYDEFHQLTKDLNEDQMYEWKAFAIDQDGELQLGHRYWGKAFYGLPRDEQGLLRRYLRMVHRHDWFGLRSWLYSQALHAAVHQVKPFTCAAQPPKGQGGYDHWHCQLRKRHDGMHRFRNYVWGEIDGESIGTHRMPERADV